MDSGYYAACTGLRTQTQALDVIANNLANLGSAGYRAQQTQFQSILAASHSGLLDPLNRAVNNFNVLGGTRLDFSNGNLQTTGNALDLALEGSGFFAVLTRAGIRYTRNGSFQQSSDGKLVTAQGDAVLGEQGRSRCQRARSASAPMALSRWQARWPENSRLLICKKPSSRR